MNIINRIFSSQKTETFQVQTEDELLGKVEEVIEKVLKDQKVQLNFQSTKNPNFSEIVKFGYREGDVFREPDVSIKFKVNSLPSKKASNVFYDVQEHVSAVIQESVSIKRVSHSSTRHELQGDEKALLADHPQLGEKGSLEFFKIAKMYPVGSKDRLLTPETSAKVKSLMKAKLAEISPIVPLREFGDGVRDAFQRALAFTVF